MTDAAADTSAVPPAPALDVRTFTLPDGRVLTAHLANWSPLPDTAPVLVSHHGTPGWSRPSRKLVEACVERGVRLLCPQRSGYAGSTPNPGRDVAAVAADVEALLDLLGVERAAVVGGSGGGPHSLATAALLPGRIVAAGTIAGVAPYGVDGLDFLAGMGSENVVEFSSAVAGEPALRAYLEEQRAGLAGVDAEQLATALDSLLPAVDRALVTGELADDMVTGFTHALSAGVDGWAEDDLAFTKPWGFDLARLADVPVSVWQGGVDLMVPAAHGDWLAEHVPGARAHLLPEDGHLSIMVGRAREIVDELVAAL